MKKLLLINDFLFAGGAETVFRKTESLMKKEGFDVQSFFGSKNYKVASNPLSYIYSFSQKKQLYHSLIKTNPDIIHVTVFNHLLSPSIFSAIKKFKKKKAVKVVYTAHDYYLLYPNSSFLWYQKGQPKIAEKFSVKHFLFKRVDHRSFLHSWLKKIQWMVAIKLLNIPSVIDTIISPSQFLKLQLEKAYPHKVEVIRNPINLDVNIRPKGKWSLPIKLLFLGRISQEKGLASFVKFLKDNKTVTLNIIGDGLEKKTLEQIILDESINNVRLTDYMDNEILMGELKKYDALVLPSIWYENAPMSLLEAASKGLYLLTSNFGGTKEIAELCGNNFLFDPNNNKSLNNSIKKLKHALINNSWTEPKLEKFDSSHYKEQLTILYKRI